MKDLKDNLKKIVPDDNNNCLQNIGKILRETWSNPGDIDMFILDPDTQNIVNITDTIKTDPRYVAKLLNIECSHINFQDSVSQPVEDDLGELDKQLVEAIEFDNLDLVKQLIKNEVNVNKANKWGVTPLQIACRLRRFEIVKILIEAGADVNKADNNGVTPLCCAIGRKHIELIKLLIKAGADVNKTDKYGRGSLWRAKYSGCTETLKLLKQHGAKG